MAWVRVHKSQDMNLHSVIVDCEHASTSGQTGVAIDRAPKPDNSIYQTC